MTAVRKATGKLPFLPELYRLRWELTLVQPCSSGRRICRSKEGEWSSIVKLIRSVCLYVGKERCIVSVDKLWQCLTWLWQCFQIYCLYTTLSPQTALQQSPGIFLHNMTPMPCLSKPLCLSYQRMNLSVKHRLFPKRFISTAIAIATQYNQTE